MQKEKKIYTGEISINSKGIGFLRLDDKKDADNSLEIQNEKLANALPYDTVEVEEVPMTMMDKRRQGKVIQILSRNKETFVGTVDSLPTGGAFVIPDDKRIYVDFFVPEKDLKNAKKKDKVFIEMLSWKIDKKNPIAKVIKILGTKGDHNSEMQSIVFEKGFEIDFPKKVEEEAEKIDKEENPIPENEYKNRKDFRQTLTFTIDPFDAKDFDDAISFKKLENGNYEIGVHIADVSHYVREGTELDLEARKRGFSVYLVDRTIPMLPEVLSNDICSLNPNIDRLTFGAVFEINSKAEVLNSWFGKTVIHSVRRFTYEEAQESLENTGDYKEELTILNTIAKILQKQKWDKGAIDFEQDEIKFKLDSNGKPIEVIRKVRKDAHKLVEEFMLLANRKVAEFIHKGYAENKTSHAAMIYRIHDSPDPAKIMDLSIFLKAMGYDLESHNGKITSKQISKVLQEIVGTPEESLIKTAAVRSMAKAIYSTRNAGHFGLAYDYYTHFTSPIRRYADLLVHRLLFRFLEGGKIGDNEIAKYEKMATDSTEREISAAEAERASIKYKQIEYMSERIGKIFDGTVSGVTSWGLYIEDLETKSEGMVRLKELKPQDFWTFDQKTYSVIGEQTKKKYTLGDKVKYKILNADLENRTIDVEIVM